MKPVIKPIIKRKSSVSFKNEDKLIQTDKSISSIKNSVKSDPKPPSHHQLSSVKSFVESPIKIEKSLSPKSDSRPKSDTFERS